MGNNKHERNRQMRHWLAGSFLLWSLFFSLTPSAYAASVVSRHIFYNGSFFDGNNPASNGSDDQAVAPKKRFQLLQGGTGSMMQLVLRWVACRGIRSCLMVVLLMSPREVAGTFIIFYFFIFFCGCQPWKASTQPVPLPWLPGCNPVPKVGNVPATPPGDR